MDAPDEDAGAAEDDKFAAVLERRRAHTAAKRAAEKACLEARRDRKRAKREGASALAAAGPAAAAAAAERAVVTYVELAAGIGSARAAMEMLRPRLHCVGWRVRNVHASDIDASKVKMYNAMASAAAAAAAAAAASASADELPSSALATVAAALPAPPPPRQLAEVADVTDRARLSPDFVASWGRVDVLVASIVCKSLSPIGKREGLGKIDAFLRGLWRILELSRPEIFVSECVPRLATDLLFDDKVLKPLRGLGYGCSYACIDARAYTGCARERLFLVCHRDAAAHARFTFPAPPDRRAAQLYPLLLPAYSKGAPPGTRQAPLRSYCATRAEVAMKSRVKKEAAAAAAAAVAAEAATAAAPAGVRGAASSAGTAAGAAAGAPPAAAAATAAKKARRPPRVRQSDWSIAAREVKKLPFLRDRQHSRVVNFQFGRVNMSETGRGIAPTLVWSPSGAYMVRDAHGLRVLVASEVAPLFGFSATEAEAAEAAVKSSTKVVSALGDSIVVFVLRDVLRAALRARSE